MRKGNGSGTSEVKFSRRKSQLRTLQNRDFGCFSVSKCHFLIANRRCDSRVIAVNLSRVAVCVDGHSIDTRRKTRSKIDRMRPKIDQHRPKCDRMRPKCDRFASVRARREFRLTSDRLRLFDFAISCGVTIPSAIKQAVCRSNQMGIFA